MPIIRKAETADLAAITEIYNDAVLKTVVTFDVKPQTLAEQRIWFESHSSKYPIFVAEEDGCVIGWASLSKWSKRGGYLDTAQVSLYVAEKHRRKGVGRELLENVLKEGEKQGLHTVIGIIETGNRASLQLSKSFGFKHAGTLKEVGRKFGKLLDVHLVQKIF